MTNNTAGLSLRDAMAAAESELTLPGDSGEAGTSPEPAPVEPVLEQPAVEEPVEAGLFDELQGEAEEQPSGDSTVEIDGTVYSTAEVKAHMMRQDDYTRKTQELAEMRREAEKAIALKELLEKRPVETVRRLYQQISTNAPITDLVETSESTPVGEQPTASSEIERLVEARVAEMLENDPRLKAVQEDKALETVNAVFSEIEDMYQVELTDADKQLVLQTAVDLNTSDLKFVFGGLMNQANQRKAALQNARKTASVAPEYVPPADEGPVVPEKFENFRSAINAALAAEQGA